MATNMVYALFISTVPLWMSAFATTMVMCWPGQNLMCMIVLCQWWHFGSEIRIFDSLC